MHLVAYGNRNNKLGALGPLVHQHISKICIASVWFFNVVFIHVSINRSGDFSTASGCLGERTYLCHFAIH